MDSMKHSISEGLRVYKVDDAERISPQFLAEWEQLLAQSSSLYCQYCSPEWIEPAIQSGLSSYSIFAVRESTDALCGLLAWREREITLVAGPRRMGLWVDRPALCIEGDVLLRRPAHPDLVRALFSVFPPDRIVQIKSITMDHPAWEALNRTRSLSSRHLRWASMQAQPLLYRVLEADAGVFDSDLSARRRRHLRQNERALSKMRASRLSIDRIYLPDQVDQFCATASGLIQKSWQRRVPIAYAYAALQNGQFLKMLAARGILRAYVLKVGERTCAFVLGYQSRGIFHYSDVAYDEDLAHASPGILLLQYLIRDLSAWNPPRLVNFGIGDATYKRLFSNSQIATSTICFLPKTPANIMLITLGRLFDALRHAKQRIAWHPAGAEPANDGSDSHADLQTAAFRE
jgi:CelD/BcsL family acetyltransferase involved in cellulose biosynthesis